MMDILEKIFGTASKVKIMRLFLFNPTDSFDMEHIITRCKVIPTEARQETMMMERIGLIKKRSFFRDYTRVRGSTKKVERRRVTGWILDETFTYLEPLQHLLIHISPLRNGDLLNRISRVGKLKLVIISGVFIQNWDTRVDLLIVGDNIKKSSLDNIVKTIESEIGRELRYTAFETPDFQYRLGIYDKLVRDILDFPHETILNKLGLIEKKSL